MITQYLNFDPLLKILPLFFQLNFFFPYENVKKKYFTEPVWDGNLEQKYIF